MKKLIALMLLCSFLVGCTTQTQHGQCIGVTDTPKENLVYRINYWNVFLGVIFSETIVVPLVIVFDSLKCPVETLAHQPTGNVPNAASSATTNIN